MSREWGHDADPIEDLVRYADHQVTRGVPLHALRDAADDDRLPRQLRDAAKSQQTVVEAVVIDELQRITAGSVATATALPLVVAEIRALRVEMLEVQRRQTELLERLVDRTQS
jgi:hypothetical protein